MRRRRLANGRLQSDAVLVQQRDQRLELPFIVTPTPHRAAIEGLPYLRGARGRNRRAIAMKLQARRMPLELAEREQCARGTLRILDDVFVLDLHVAIAERLAPMTREPVELDVVARRIE